MDYVVTALFQGATDAAAKRKRGYIDPTTCWKLFGAPRMPLELFDTRRQDKRTRMLPLASVSAGVKSSV